MGSKLRFFAVFTLAAALQAGVFPQEREWTAYVHARVVVSPSKIMDDATILVRDGRIEDLGREVDVPWEAKVTDCRGKWIYPGFVDIASRAGLPGSGNPEFKASGSFNTDKSIWKPFVENGFTTIALVPAGRGLAGRIAVIRPKGKKREEMLVYECVGMAAYVGNSGAYCDGIRKGLELAEKEVERRKKKAEPGSRPASKPGKGSRPATKPAGKAGKKPGRKVVKVPGSISLLADILEWKLPLFVTVSGPGGLLYLGKAIGKRKLPILVIAERGRRMYSRWPPLCVLAGKVKELGASVALQPGLSGVPYRMEKVNQFLEFKRNNIQVMAYPGDNPEDIRNFRPRLARLVRTGLKESDALASITTVPAEWLCMGKRIGTLEEGKDANFVIFSGNFLDFKSRILKVVIEGDPVYEYSEE